MKLREFIILPKKSHKQFVFRRMQNVTVIITMLKFFPQKGMEHGCFLQKKLYFYGGKIFKYEFFTRNCSKCKIKIFVRSGNVFTTKSNVIAKIFCSFLSSLLNYMFMVNLYKSSEAHKNTIKLFLLRVFNPFKRVIIFPHKKHKACCKKYKALILK